MQIAAEVPIGTVIMAAGTINLKSFILCDGQSHSRTTYPDLFKAIGIVFGAGSGPETFQTPDFRGIFPKGSGATTRASGKDSAGNPYAANLGDYSHDKMQGFTVKVGVDAAGANVSRIVLSSGDLDNGAYGSTAIIADGTHGDPRMGFTTEPQSLAVTFYIKAKYDVDVFYG